MLEVYRKPLDWMQEQGEIVATSAARQLATGARTVRVAGHVRTAEDLLEEQGRGQRRGNRHHPQVWRDGDGGGGVECLAILNSIRQEQGM
jgi:hypothetical protein